LIAALFGVASCSNPAPYNPAPYADPYPAIAPSYNVTIIFWIPPPRTP